MHLAPTLSTTKQITLYQQTLLQWFTTHKRDLPWRHERTPYKVWLAEIMLQQTTVATVTGYYTRFLEKFPTVEVLASSPLEDVLHLWQGLGYYSRARNLHACAKTVVALGGFPKTAAKLQLLPGIGPYTAAAVAALAFAEAATVVDGNIERILSRLFCIQTPLPTSRPQIYAHGAALTPQQNSGAYAEALMDLGATICTPKAPKCAQCPVQQFCKAAHTAAAHTLPHKQIKPTKPHKTGVAYCITNPQGHLFLQKRPSSGLLASLWEVPHKGWEEHNPHPHFATQHLSNATVCGTIKHVFTHFSLTLEVHHVCLPTTPNTPYGLWVNASTLNNYPTSTLMKKVTHVFFRN